MTKVKKNQEKEICNNVERSFDLSKEDNLNFLRKFDLDYKYGPCYGKFNSVQMIQSVSIYFKLIYYFQELSA